MSNQWPQPQQQPYPQGGYYPPVMPPKKKRKWPWIVGGIIVVLIIVGAAGGGKEEEKKTAAQETNTSTTVAGETSTTTKAKTGYSLGETAKTSDLTVIVYSITDPATSSNSFEEPKAGNRFVSVDMQVESSKQETFSSLLAVELVTSDNRTYSAPLLIGFTPRIDGDLLPGQARRGYVPFEIPADAKVSSVRVKGSITAAGAVFNLS